MLTRPLDYLPPTQTTIEVEPKGLRVVRGAPVTIQAATAALFRTRWNCITWTGTNERGELVGAEKVAMESLGAGKFSAKIARLEKNPALSRRHAARLLRRHYTAEAIDPPEIANVQLLLYPPAYTGLASVAAAGRQHRRA